MKVHRGDEAERNRSCARRTDLRRKSIEIFLNVIELLMQAILTFKIKHTGNIMLFAFVHDNTGRIKTSERK